MLVWCVEGQVICGGRKDTQIPVKYYSESEALKVTVIALDFGHQELDGSYLLWSFHHCGLCFLKDSHRLCLQLGLRFRWLPHLVPMSGRTCLNWSWFLGGLKYVACWGKGSISWNQGWEKLVPTVSLPCWQCGLGFQQASERAEVLSKFQSEAPRWPLCFVMLWVSGSFL